MASVACVVVAAVDVAMLVECLLVIFDIREGCVSLLFSIHLCIHLCSKYLKK